MKIIASYSFFYPSAVPKVRKMFERMQMLPALEHQTVMGGQAKRQNVTTVWRNTNYSRPILNQACPLNDTEKACDLFETCALEFSMLLKETEERLAHKRPMNYDMESTQYWLHSITVNIAFYGGLCVGSIFGGSCIFICSTICMKGCKSSKDVDRENRRRYRVRADRQGECCVPVAWTLILNFSHLQKFGRCDRASNRHYQNQSTGN